MLYIGNEEEVWMDGVWYVISSGKRLQQYRSVACDREFNN